MTKCPFCGFANEDGALFCEQCKSDVSSVPAAAPAEEVVAAQIIEDLPDGAIVEAVEAVEAVEVIPIEQVDVAAPEGMAVVEAQVAPAPADVASPPPGFYNAAAEADPPHAVEAEVIMPVAMAEQLAPHHAPPPPPAPPVAAAPPPPPPVAPPPAPAPAAAAAAGGNLPAGAQPKLVVMRGQKVGFEFPIYPSENYIGRADDKPVDVDLEDQEPPDRVWCSRQHAVIHFDDGAGVLTIEDLNSSNGTFVNRARVYPGQPKQLAVGDVVQIGTVHLKLKV